VGLRPGELNLQQRSAIADFSYVPLGHPKEPILNEVQNETVAQMTERMSKITFFPNEPIF
jgi:hypothetical protein